MSSQLSTILSAVRALPYVEQIQPCNGNINYGNSVVYCNEQQTAFLSMIRPQRDWRALMTLDSNPIMEFVSADGKEFFFAQYAGPSLSIPVNFTSAACIRHYPLELLNGLRLFVAAEDRDVLGLMDAQKNIVASGLRSVPAEEILRRATFFGLPSNA